MIRQYLLGGIVLTGAIVIIVLLSESTDEVSRSSEVQTVRTLKSFHADFRREDGSAYDDESLVALLMAKGIPFVPDVVAPQPKAAGNFTLYFISRAFSETQQKEINDRLNEILAVYAEEKGRKFNAESLKKGFVTTELKLQLFFSEDFKAIADNESELTDFNESLNELGFHGLKGLEIFIEDRPLGEYLRELDARRNAEAAAGQTEKMNIR